MNFNATLDGLSSKNFIRLKDGETVMCLFQGEPHDFKQHWDGNKSRLCTGEGCIDCSKGIKASFRFRINVVVSENGVLTAKIFEQGATVYKNLRTIHANYDLSKNFMSITRTGSDRQNTAYMILPHKSGTISSDVAARLQSVVLHDLKNFEATAKAAETKPSETFDDMPF